MKNSHTLIIGSSSGIAQALLYELTKNKSNQIITVSRTDESNSSLRSVQSSQSSQSSHFKIKDYSEGSIDSVLELIFGYTNRHFDQVIICNVLLHDDSVKPEKRIDDFSESAFNQVMKVNVITPMLWIKNLASRLKGKQATKLVVLSARVGSISDNRLGGWYSYRSSKSALNMILKTIAIEFSVKAKNIKVIAFHPGTTDTSLSKPFQKNVPEGKLFSPKFVAERLLEISQNMPVDGKLSFVDWQGESIDW